MTKSKFLYNFIASFDGSISYLCGIQLPDKMDDNFGRVPGESADILSEKVISRAGALLTHISLMIAVIAAVLTVYVENPVE